MSTRKDNRAARLLESGMAQLQEGHAERARELCEEALKLAPRHPDALHLRGVIALHDGDHASAVKMLERAVALRPDIAHYRCNLGHGYVGLKRLREALSAFKHAAALEPGDPEFEMGVGNCLGLLQQPAEAEVAFRRVIARHPQYALGWFNLAKALDDQDRDPEACDCYMRVTQLAPQFAEAYVNLGNALSRLKRYEEAERAFRACLARNARLLDVQPKLASVLNSLRRHEEAEAICLEVLARTPDHKGARAGLRASLKGQSRWREALACLEQDVKDDPENLEIRAQLGEALARNGLVRKALTVFDSVLADPAAPVFVHYSKAACLFSAGLVSEGAAEYLWVPERQATATGEIPEKLQTTNLPPELSGVEVALVGEQGLGDELFFLRYAPLLKARGCRIHYFGNPKILDVLLGTTVLDRLSSRAGEAGAGMAALAMLGDLPHLFSKLPASPWRPAGITKHDVMSSGSSAAFALCIRVYWPKLPAPLPLSPSPARVAAVSALLRRLGAPPYVALTWRAGTPPEWQRGKVSFLFKQVGLEALAKVLRDTPGTLVSLQRNPDPGETTKLASLVGRAVHDLSALNDNLADMLAALTIVDEYVGVSNTNTHLRASAGRTGRVLVPWPPEWRWMISGEESPWFPGFRIYRQKPDGDWTAALDRLRQDLRAASGEKAG